MAKKSFLTPDTILTILAQTPERIAALTKDLVPAHLHGTPAQGEWVLNDVLAHLRACADVWGDCMRTMLAEEHPTIRAINPQAWIERTDYRDLEFHQSFGAFARQRAELLAMLGPLPPEGWARTATITGAGAPLQRTVLEFGSRMARHERAHVTHIKRFVKAIRDTR